MQLEPLLNAMPPIPSHAIAAMAALALGTVQLARPKGTASHRYLGWGWVVLMAYVAISGFFINEFRTWGPFSPIHILSIVTLVTLGWAIHSARNRRIGAHKRAMTTLFFLALVVNGLFVFLPGRTLHQVVVG